MTLSDQVHLEAARRRTFAIISHPDAGKTTLTEKFLLYGGALQSAGAVKARGGRRSATSDWMEMEQERGISITSTVLQFPYRDFVVNLLDTPGHKDFSEDTYRVLSAADVQFLRLRAGPTRLRARHQHRARRGDQGGQAAVRPVRVARSTRLHLLPGRQRDGRDRARRRRGARQSCEHAGQDGSGPLRRAAQAVETRERMPSEVGRYINT